MNAKPKSRPLIRRKTNLGSMQAEEDQQFLDDCFINTEECEQVLDIENSKFLLMGRTGSGKSAIIKEIEKQEEVVLKIEPESLALNYISNSDVLVILLYSQIPHDTSSILVYVHQLEGVPC